MKRLFRRVLIVLLAVVFIGSVGYSIKTLLDYRHEAELYQKAQNDFITALPTESPAETAPPTTEAPKSDDIAPPETEPPAETEPDRLVDFTVDFDALKNVNSDSIGWLYIPNTVMSQPIVQGYDNQYYVRQAYDHSYSMAGSIFADYRTASNFSDSISIIYGHNMKNTTMFSTLHYYENRSYALGHPYFYILTPEKTLQYEVCYAMIAPSTSYVYAWDFSEVLPYTDHLDQLRQDSLYNNDLVLSEEDHIVTLSTCTGVVKSDRFVVIGRLIDEMPTT